MLFGKGDHRLAVGVDLRQPRSVGVASRAPALAGPVWGEARPGAFPPAFRAAAATLAGGGLILIAVAAEVLAMDGAAVVKRLQLWRVVTASSFFGGSQKMPSAE